MMKRIGLLLILISMIGILCLLNGCLGKTPSTGVETSRIYAKFRVDHYADNSVKASAQFLRDGAGGTRLDLTTEEHLYCNGVEMSEGVDHWYFYNFNFPDSSGEYLFRFCRKNSENINTTLVMAALPNITSATPSTLYPGDDLTVQWNASQPGSIIRLLVKGINSGIIYPIDRSVTDNGYCLVDSSDINLYAGVSTGSYGLIVTTTRIKYEPDAVNPAYQGGFNEVQRYASGNTVYLEIP